VELIYALMGLRSQNFNKVTMDSAGETHVINVENDASEDFQLGNTLKRTTPTTLPTPDQKHKRRISGEDNRNGSIFLKDNTYRKIFSKLDLDSPAIHSCLAMVGSSVSFHPIFC
jgi:hypothetical protein